MFKGFIAVIVAVVILSVTFTNGGNDGGSTDTGYNQPLAGVQIQVNADDSSYLSVAVTGANAENWLWNDGNNGLVTVGNWQPSSECANGQGQYSGEIKFWQRTSPEDYAFEPSAGQMVKHIVSWKSGCEPSGMSVQVFMPGE